jgi:hypothetical protein
MFGCMWDMYRNNRVPEQNQANRLINITHPKHVDSLGQGRRGIPPDVICQTYEHAIVFLPTVQGQSQINVCLATGVCVLAI